MPETINPAMKSPITDSTMPEQVSDAEGLIPLGLARKVLVNPLTGTATIPLSAKRSVEVKISDTSSLTSLLVLMGERLVALEERIEKMEAAK